MYQSDYTSEEELETFVILKDTEENIENSNNIPIITYRKKGIPTDLETTSAGITEYVFFHHNSLLSMPFTTHVLFSIVVNFVCFL